MKRTILENDINIFLCKNRTKVNDVIKYFKENNIIKKKKINIKLVKTISSPSWITSLIRLKDGRVASSSNYQKLICSCSAISIYAPSNDYQYEEIIERHSKKIPSICELDDGIVSCTSGSSDFSINIGNYIFKDVHNNYINKVIASHHTIATCSEDKTIKIFDCNTNNPWDGVAQQTIVTLELKGHTDNVYSLLYIEDRNILISGSKDRTLRLWLPPCQCTTVIEGVECCSPNSLYQIDKERVIVGGENSFCIVNINV